VEERSQKGDNAQIMDQTEGFHRYALADVECHRNQEGEIESDDANPCPQRTVIRNEWHQHFHQTQRLHPIQEQHHCMHQHKSQAQHANTAVTPKIVFSGCRRLSTGPYSVFIRSLQFESWVKTLAGTYLDLAKKPVHYLDRNR